ncbi:MAG: LamG-like jellyroll fold domain-containing protein [Aminobacterium sp.]|nr:hypothetical protein [Aminobacterium sp.]MDD3708010.1 hypothetical protein [Aminobacterium sp.]MDD4228284.1 hypothetical protein [Aminobacterium sp.]MDD4551321.1 hypothetical protein [Aminobacterium sp.]
MSHQRRSFFSLKCNPPDCAIINDPPLISLCGSTPFTLSARFYISSRESNATIITQEGVFSLEIVKGALRFFSKGLGTFTLDIAKDPLAERDWNKVDIVYDKTNVIIYLQGFPALSAKTSSSQSSFIDKNTPWKMGLMEGYLQDVEFYSQALDKDEVQKLFFSNHHISRDKIELWADFGEYEPLDRSSRKHKLQLTGGCDIVNLVYGITPGKEGCIVPIGTAPVNPGSKECSTFTLLAKVYLGITTEDNDTYIFCNGTPEKPGSVCLGLSDKQTRPFFSLGEKRFTFDREIKAQRWIDLTATVSSTSVSLYIDGSPAGSHTISTSPARTEGAEIYLGNCQKGRTFNNGLQGHLDSICIFSSALTAEKLTEYADVAPYYFAPDLKALWIFSQEGNGAEILHGGNLAYSKTEVTLIENTVLDRELPPFEFAMPDNETGFSNMEEWQNRFAAEVFLQILHSVTGLEATRGFKDEEKQKLNGSMSLLLRNCLTSDPSLSNLMIEDEPDSKDILEFILAIYGCFELSVILYSFYCAWITHNPFGTRPFMVRFLYCVSKCIKSPEYLAANGAFILAVNRGIKGYREIHHFPNTDPSQPTGSEECTLLVKSIAFYDETLIDAGALLGRPDFDHDPVLPEWNSSELKNASILYHNQGEKTENIFVKATLNCNNFTNEKIVVTIGARTPEKSLLGRIPEINFTVTKSGNYTVKLPLKDNTLSGAHSQCYTQQWEWYFKVKGKVEPLGTTEHKIYVILGKPLSPWTTEKDTANLPVYPMIDLCNEVTKQECTETAKDRKFASQFVKWFRSCGKFASRERLDSPQNARWTNFHRILTIDGKAILTSIQNFEKTQKTENKAAFNDLETACFHCLLARLEGVEGIKILELSPGHNVSGFLLRGGKGPDGIVMEKGIRGTYSVCGIYPGSGKIPQIWDAFLQLKGSDNKWITATGIAFGAGDRKSDLVGTKDDKQYRSLLCMPFNTCQVGLKINVLKMNTLPLTKITSGNPVLDITPGRLDFDKSVQEGIKLNPFQVRCHAISYESIEKAIVLCINTANENASHIAKEDYVNLLENLCRAVTLTPEGEVPLSTTMEGSTFLELAFLEEDFNFPLDDEGKKDIVEYCNQLLYSLNSCLPNLRTGMSDWNSSIGANLDLEEWIHVTGDGEQCYVDCAWDNPDIFEILENTILSGLPVPPNVGFYIRNTKDCHRLFHLREFLLGIRNKGASPLKQNPFILRMAHVDLYNELLQDKISDPRKRIRSSSNNNWRLNDYIRHNMSSSYPQEEPIYFLAKDSNGNLFWLQWPNAQYMYNIPLPANN